MTQCLEQAVVRLLIDTTLAGGAMIQVADELGRRPIVERTRNILFQQAGIRASRGDGRHNRTSLECGGLTPLSSRSSYFPLSLWRAGDQMQNQSGGKAPHSKKVNAPA
jgi:hypothetical protein